MRKRRLAAVVSALVAPLLVIVFVLPAGGTTKSHRFFGFGLRARISSVDPVQSAAFSVLSGAPVSAPPQPVATFAARPGGQHFGVNPSLARAIKAPDGSGETWYVVPGNGAVCLVASFDLCGTTAQAKAGTVWASEVPGTPPYPPDLSEKFVGLVPDGADTVVVRNHDGTTSSAPVANNTYSVDAKGASELMFERGNQNVLTVIIPTH